MTIVYTDSIDILAEPEQVLRTLGDLKLRGHYYPDGVTGIREVVERPSSLVDQFLPGQRVAFNYQGVSREHMIAEVVEWDNAEASIVERPLRNLKSEIIEWRLSELTMGTVRVTITVSGNYNAIEKIAARSKLKNFWGTTLSRLKSYLEDKITYAGPHTFAQNS
ncbi:MAG: SRPBCC family protein [Candidatus Nitrosotenuis sp.]